MPNTGALPMNHENHVLTPLQFSKPTNHFADGKAPIADEIEAADEGPKFKSTLYKIDEATTSKEAFAHRKL